MTDRVSSIERCWSSLLRLLMVLWRSLLRIDKASLLETFGSLKMRKSMSNFSLFFLYSSFSYFRKSLTVTFPYLRAISLEIFKIFKNAKVSKKFLVSYDVTSIFTSIRHQETIDIAITLIFNHNPDLNITKKELKNFSFSLHHRLILFLTVSFIIK